MVQPVSFWGLVLEPLKMYSQQVPVSFKITMASLGPEAKEGASRSTVMLVHEKDGEFALCSLTPGKVDQQPLDIVLRQGDTIHLRVEGNCTVHLVGYYVDLGEDDDEEMDSELSEGESLCDENMCSEGEYDSELDEYETEDDSDEEEEDDETEESDAEMTDDSEAESVEEAKPRRKGPKVTLVSSDEEEEDLSEDEESEEDSDIENDEELDSDELCNSEFSEEEAEVEEVADKKRKAPAPTIVESKKPKLVTPQATPKAAKTADVTAHQQNRKELPKVQAQQSPQTPKVQTPNGKVQTPKETPKQSPAVKASPAPKASPASVKASPAAPQKENAKPAALQSKTLPNGVSLEDLNLGEGIKAQKGRKVSVTVTLASQDGKSLGKQTLTFTCGSNEQAKGLDAGVVGMALNGERKLVIPAGLMKDTPVVATVKLDKVVNTK